MEVQHRCARTVDAVDLSGLDGADLPGLEDTLGGVVEDHCRRAGMAYIDDAELASRRRAPCQACHRIASK